MTRFNQWKAQGKRMTRVRTELLALFRLIHEPLRVKQIMMRLGEKGLKPHKTTVYRELVFLVNEGVVREVTIDRAARYYESAELYHHHHLVCTQCQSIADISYPQLEQVMESMKETAGERHHFNIDKHLLEFYGTCQTCQKVKGAL